MPTYDLPYGRGKTALTLPDGAHVTWILPNAIQGAPHPEQACAEALAKPVDGSGLDSWKHVRSAAIALNDKTRPAPHAAMLPPLLRQLESLGIAPKRITLIIATGTHPPTPEAAFADVIPAGIVQRYRVLSHDCDVPDLVDLGATSRGTPVAANRAYMEADLRIVIGNIEPHHFAGYSGGVKSAAIGLGGRETVTRNHALLLDPRAVLACYDDNPLRQDIEEIGQRIGVHFALNVVMNQQKQIVQAFAGDPRAVMRAGLSLVRRIYEVPVASPFDLLITCPGGYPKDINLYQAHKAVSCANRITRAGGCIVLVAACEDGVGSQGYEAFMARGFATHQEAMEQFVREPFRIGAHKAYIFGRDAVRVQGMWIVSEIAAERVRRLLLKPASLDEATAEALALLPAGARIGIMPYANATIPVFATL